MKRDRKSWRIMKDDIIINKSETIKRCFDRINEEYASDPLNLTNFTKQDSIILNIQRMCESCLDIAMHIIRVKQLEIPQISKEGFQILEKNKIIDEKLSLSLQRMVGFRNIAVHNYQNLNLDIVQAVIENHIQDPMRFIHVILDY
jgi:uncharacterized protein YutE (UPF0331/DUF86 family)